MFRYAPFTIFQFLSKTNDSIIHKLLNIRLLKFRNDLNSKIVPLHSEIERENNYESYINIALRKNIRSKNIAELFLFRINYEILYAILYFFVQQ